MADQDQPVGFRQLMQLLIRLSTGKFFGSVTVNFRAGQITTIEQHQTFKASDLPTDP